MSKRQKNNKMVQFKYMYYLFCIKIDKHRRGIKKMKSKIGLLGIIGLLVLVVMASGCTNQNDNQTTPVNNSTNSSTNNTSTVKSVDVSAKMTGPATATKGSTVTLNCSVTNKGSKPVQNVLAHSQEIDKNLGTLNAGQTKTFTWNIYIPTDKEIQEDFGDDATVSNPFYIGGFAVTFTDSNGSKHTLNSNSLEIKLS
jgi:hypothetical protein